MNGTMSCVAAALLVAAAPALGQTGFTPEGARNQRALETRVLASIGAEDLARTGRALAARPHVAGSPGQAAVRDSLLAWLDVAGLDVEVATYEVFLPWPTRVSVTLVEPDSIPFTLTEPPIAGDPATGYEQYPWVNGYSGTGVAEAEVVYAGYGLHDDYAVLDSLGVDVADRIVVARYGRSYRGVKARLAERRGAAALVLYSDPVDDGYARGDVYPHGPFRPWTGVQRGSVMNGVGDPTTPHGPSVAGADRVEPGSPGTIPSIPVVPVSYGAAAEILERLEGPEAPEREWQGGLPFRYHVGPGSARLRVEVDDDRDGPRGGMKPLHDVVARIEGRTWPDEWVVVGGHLDAWGAGAMDNVSGTVSVVAAARAVAELVRDGHRPRRTIVFAGWDGEEWGLIGSTEWVEEHAEALVAGGVAYLNQDVVGGRRFRGGGSPSLEPLVKEAARAVPMGGGRSLFETWREEFGSEPAMGNLGGGSDFAGFYNHLAIPSASFGFTSPGGVYHSAYDTAVWMDEFGDPGYENHARSAELVAILALRLANAEVLPYDHVAWAAEIDSLWRDRVLRTHREAIDPDIASEMSIALATLRDEARRLEASREAYLAGPIDPERSREANRTLRSVERALSRETGLVDRPWYRNIAFASDARNGYATLAFPSVVEAVRDGEEGRVRREIRDLARRVREAAVRLRAAAAALE